MTQVYVLYTGGTIGSGGSPLVPMSGLNFTQLVLSMPDLANFQVSGYDGLYYTIDSLDTPLDSSDMTPSDWIIIAQRILSKYADYDGFVVLHGTDTMAWTASALSFFFQGLSKPVIITGSQLPLAHPLTDARRNLMASIVLAGTAGIPEVCLYSDTTLMRGNRTTKADTHDLRAFVSPNFPPLAMVGSKTTLNTTLILPSPPPATSLENPDCLAACRASLDTLSSAVLNFSIVEVALFPGIQSTTMLTAILQGTRPPVKGIVLGAFGQGDAPSSRAFLDTIAAANECGITIIDSTQVIKGSVDFMTYQTGSGLAQAGAISGHDLTPEAALTKLIYLVGLGLDQHAVKAQMQTSLCGEITVPPV